MDNAVGRVERRRGHYVALQALYEADAVSHPAGAVVVRLSRAEELSPGAAEIARHLVAGVVAHRGEIDGWIVEAAPTWPLNQMARVDKNVLRLAIYEAFMDNAAVPVRAAINDAIELAKTFGSDSSSKFVNGVLATLAERHPNATITRSDPES